MRNKKQCLILDCQGLQTTSFERGMGRYTFHLLKTIFKNSKLVKNYDKFVLLFNQNLNLEASDFITNNFDSKHFSVDVCNILNEKKASKEIIKKAKKTLDEYIDNKYSVYDVTFVILSNFELDQAISAFPSKAKKAILIYDLIPLLFANEYLENASVEKDYLSRYINIFESDIIFSISENTKQDLITYLNLDGDNIINIGGGPINISENGQNKVAEIRKPFYLFPSGDNWRKNNKRVIEAFKLFNHANSFQLVVTSSFEKKTAEELSGNDPDIVFVGQVSNEELNWLYHNSLAVVFPSLAEGLGLPVLEAAMMNKRILLSNIPVFMEFNHPDVEWCDPENVGSISEGFKKIQSKINQSKPVNIKKILENHNWNNTSTIFSTELAKRKSKINNKKHQKKIALVGPTYEGYSAIGKFSQDLMVSLSKIAHVDYYYEDILKRASLRKAFAKYVWNYLPISKLPANINKYEKVIYNIGNSEYHVLTYLLALIFPDTIILHDLNLSGLHSCIENKSKKFNKYSALEKKLNNVFKESALKYAVSLCERQKNIVVHSNFAKKELESLIGKESARIIKQDLPVPAPIINPRSNKKLTIAFSGIISNDKGVSIFKDLVEKYHNRFLFLVFGFSWHDSIYLELTNLEKKGYINLFTNISDYKFDQLLASSDVLISVRPNYNGETSKTVLDGLRVGVVPVINNVGWFKEIPNEISYKVENKEDILNILNFDRSYFLNTLKKKKSYIYNFVRTHNYDSYTKKIMV